MDETLRRHDRRVDEIGSVRSRKNAIFIALAVATSASACAELEGKLSSQVPDSAYDRAVAIATRSDEIPPSAPVRTTPTTRADDARTIRGFIRRAPVPQDSSAASDASTQTADVANGKGEIMLDFERVDLSNVIRVMLEDGLGASYAIDPSVDGEVTLRTNRPLTKEEILPTLEEILRLNDAAIVLRGGLYQVLPRAAVGLSAPLISARNAEARGLTVRVTPLRNVAVIDIVDALEGFSPTAGAISFDRNRNLVFSIGSEAEQATIADLLAALDTDYLASRSVALRPLLEADAEGLQEELELLFATPSGRPNPALQFLAINRMNAILAIADKPDLLDEALVMIRELDQGAGEMPRLHVFEIANRRAGELAVVLSEIFDAEAAGAVETTDDGNAVAPSLTLVVDRSSDRAPTTDADTPTATARPTGTRRQADQRGPSGVFADLGLGAPGGVYRIVADEASNAVIALATGEGARAIENALRQLDVKPLQVMIEATLIEVVLNDQLNYGIRWFLESGNFEFGFSDVATGATGAVFPGFNAAFQTNDVQATLSALESVSDIKILSSPTLMVLDDETARLQVGDQVPVTVRSSTGTTADSNIVTEEEFRDTGVILEIRPTVNAGGAVVLGVRQEVSSVAETVEDENPTISQRVVQSTIAVQSGETVALAGLIQENATTSRAGLPVLSRLPVIGAAFGATNNSVDRSELLVLIRPLVVRDQTEARAATDELRRKLTILGAGSEREPEESAR